jgi:acyl-CoA thioester hydrolase
MAKPDPALLDPARYPFMHEIGTRFADLDPNDHINNVAMAALLEDGRVRFNAAAGLPRARPELRFMVASVAIDYLAQAHYPGTLTCHCGAASLGRTSFAIQQLLRQGDSAVAVARTVVVCTDGQRPIPLPDLMRGAFDTWMLR